MVRKNQQHSEKGNVLFLILIAVALFAALSYAVTQSTRSGGGDASKEKNVLEASTLAQQSVAIRQAVMRMMITQNIAPEELLFDTPSAFSGLTADEISREVFHPNGGGAIYQNGMGVTASLAINNIGTTDDSQPLKTTDIVAIKEISKDICKEVNKKNGIVIADADMDISMDLSVEYNAMNKAYPGINGSVDGFWGTIGSTRALELAPYDGRPQGCIFTNVSGMYFYYDVIVSR